MATTVFVTRRSRLYTAFLGLKLHRGVGEESYYPMLQNQKKSNN